MRLVTTSADVGQKVCSCCLPNTNSTSFTSFDASFPQVGARGLLESRNEVSLEFQLNSV